MLWGMMDDLTAWKSNNIYWRLFSSSLPEPVLQIAKIVFFWL